MEMTIDLSNAYHNLWNLRTASGLEIPDDMSAWAELYRDVFLNVLKNTECNENRINFIIKGIYKNTKEYSYNNRLARSDPRDFMIDGVDEKSCCAAYGLLVFDEIIRLLKIQ